MSLDGAVANINILQAIQWIKESRNSVPSATIQNYFRYCHITDRPSGQADDDDPFTAEIGAPETAAPEDVF